MSLKMISPEKYLDPIETAFVLDIFIFKTEAIEEMDGICIFG